MENDRRKVKSAILFVANRLSVLTDYQYRLVLKRLSKTNIYRSKEHNTAIIRIIPWNYL